MFPNNNNTEHDSLSDGRSLQFSTFEGMLEEGRHGDHDSFDTRLQEEGIARTETKAVSLVKKVMLIMLVIVAAIASVLTWSFISHQESKNFKDAFDGHANRLLDKFHVTTEQRVAAASSLSVTITSQVKNTFDPESSWPNVTVPDFQEHCAIPLHTAQANWIAFAPMIYSREERVQWEAYAVENEMSRDTHVESPLLQVPDGAPPTATTETFPDDNDENGDRFLEHVHPNRTVAEGIYRKDADGHAVDDLTQGPYAPIWQISPHAGLQHMQMFNLFDGDICQRGMDTMLWSQGVVLSEIMYDPEDPPPKSFFMVPVFRNFTSRNIVGTVVVEIDWRTYFEDALPKSAGSVRIIVENTCGQKHTFESRGDQVVYVGEGHAHDHRFQGMKRILDKDQLHYLCDSSVPYSNVYLNGYTTEDKVPGSEYANSNYKSTNATQCHYSVAIYPTAEFESKFITNSPISYTFFVVVIFVLTSTIFLVYDCIVERRQVKVMRAAVQAKSIVNSLFPRNVRDRVFRSAQQNQPKGMEIAVSNVGTSVNGTHNKKQHLKRILAAGTAPSREVRGELGEPIADLFPHTTVMFADIAGFTAWSSEREPHQVFQLLEGIWSAFDAVAHRLGVFKVETIGDSYVAVTGLPEANVHHAVIMARFALECLSAMNELIKEMEVALGPGTADLAMRFGLHSGPVTAGVLRGEKSRFQLFGDTMNTASRMESTSKPGLIQVSHETSHLIVAAGKEHWLDQRDGMVAVKGKGEMQTFWLRLRRKSQQRTSFLRDQSEGESVTRVRNSKMWGYLDIDESVSSRYSLSEKEDRLIDWNVEVLLGFIEKIVSRRFEAQGRQRWSRLTPKEDSVDVLEEVTEIIVLPDFDSKAAKRNGDCSLSLPSAVKSQLKEFVSTIASLYQGANAFHNFEHASHVLMSATKLIKRIVSPTDLENSRSDKREKSKLVEELHNSTFGISSDPLAQFAIVFSALVHDVEHLGVPNGVLVKEKHKIALRYKNKSVAEQNSVVVAWEVLMEERFAELQGCIFASDDERKRFRQLVVNQVMATDIMDRDLHTLRKNRWAKAFHSEEAPISTTEDSNRKATIVMEHIIQASDVAHTMQHWHIYVRWNERLFNEMYTAYLNGRSEKDPSENWYEGEIWFFDNYIIPLAKKLTECGVFGVSSDEYLQYAIENRREWEMKGKDVAAATLAKFLQQNQAKSVRSIVQPTDEETVASCP